MTSSHQLLRQSIHQHATARMLVPGTGTQFGLRLLNEDNSGEDHGIWTGITSGETGLLPKLTAGKAVVAVSIDHGRMRISFQSACVGHRQPLLGAQRVLLAWPVDLKIEERRTHPRERPLDSDTIGAALIRTASRTFEGRGLRLGIWDVSVGGASLICPAQTPLRLRPAEELELHLRIKDSDHRIRGRHCHSIRLPSGQLRFGVEFDRDSIPQATRDLLLALVDELRAQQMRQSIGRTMMGIG
jgi:hypothetical protein